jgi:hypothetical protein
VKKRMATSLWFRSVDGALRTIAGYEAMNVIRKGQIRWLAKGDALGQAHYISRSSGSLRSRTLALEIAPHWHQPFATDPPGGYHACLLHPADSRQTLDRTNHVLIGTEN